MIPITADFLQTQHFRAMVEDIRVFQLIDRCEGIFRNCHCQIMMPQFVICKRFVVVIDPEKISAVKTTQEHSHHTASINHRCILFSVDKFAFIHKN